MQHNHQQADQQQADQQQEQPDQNQEQHPFVYIFVGRRTFYLLSLNDILRLRKICRWLRELFRALQLRQRLSHSLCTQAGLRRTASGQQLLTFDEQQMGVSDLLAALCVTEEGGWREMSEAVELAGQCGRCQLPVRLTATDLHRYPNKTAYLADPRVLAHLKMVGPHIDFGNGVTFQLFHHGNTLRAIKDQEGFELTIDPPLPPNHPYQQHRQQHDPPVRNRITFVLALGWHMSLSRPRDYSSVSSYVKSIVIDHFRGTHQINFTRRTIDRNVDNNRLDTIVIQSPHTPVEGCTTTASYRCTDGFRRRRLILTDAGHPFVAWIYIMEASFHNFVHAWVCTTEPAVSGVGDAFKDRFPQTTRLARVVLGAIISAILFDR
ncbi:unnamed protein product [Vitrella brassicaformis CCMP3155]|uniref:Uncharacterized protein n=1 Tax=Vitrella brassicaformis (strain CCMP3155) TaxID=1169540 RepID=A0A0G4FBK2_VITBC|nr:unnamed protein product [Vitrella brassicaformis CCMP3155]|eukprot:CEM10250.1 unnamed protein product [Vitrella brassicaformis CCMP3155]